MLQFEGVDVLQFDLHELRRKHKSAVTIKGAKGAMDLVLYNDWV
jgi:hypothetical protein